MPKLRAYKISKTHALSGCLWTYEQSTRSQNSAIDTFRGIDSKYSGGDTSVIRHVFENNMSDAKLRLFIPDNFVNTTSAKVFDID